MLRKWARTTAAIAAAGLASCNVTGTVEPGSVEALGAAEDWVGVGGAPDEAGYSRLTQIDTGNADRLGLAWSLDLPGEVTLEATPLAVDGTLYFSGSHAAVYAVDGATGEQLWRYDPETWKHSPQAMHFSFGANRGVAYEDRRVFVSAMDGRLIALDAQTGKELWVVDAVPEGMVNVSTGAPRTMNGKVIIGNAGADFGARGFVTAFDAATGKQLWRFFTVPGKPEDNAGDPVMEAAAKTWSEGFYKRTGGGGTVWNGITFDPELNQVYIGVGNAGPYDPDLRDPGGGDNLYTSSIVALDADTGKYVWHYQETPRDSWDYKATPNMVTATLPIAGKPTKVLLHIPTNGFFYVIDRATGKPLSAAAATKVTWAKGIDLETGRPIENEGIRYPKGSVDIWPGTIGGHNWQAMSYSPKARLAYIPMHQIGTRFSRQPSTSDHAFNVLGLFIEPLVAGPDDGKGSLVAWDPVTQKARWTVKHDHLWNGGVLSTAGDLVFQGTADGAFSAYHAGSGERLWQFPTGLGIIAAPMSYAIGDKQYVAVLVGYGGTTAAYGKYMDMGYKYGRQPRRLLAFALDGKARLPATPPPDFEVAALDDPALKLDRADVEVGKALFGQCAACHGISLHATGTPGPDLRESSIALDLASFRTLLKEGPLMPRGMPRFEMLTDRQIGQLHAYIRAGAREALGRQKEPAPGTAPMTKGRQGGAV